MKYSERGEVKASSIERLIDHFLIRFRNKKVLKHVPSEGSLLDIASGDGHLIKTALNEECTGIDVRQCVKKYKDKNGDIKIEFTDGIYIEDTLPFGDEEFDNMTIVASIGYFKDLKLIFRECSRILKNGGTFVFSTPLPAAQKILFFVDMGYKEYFDLDKVESLMPDNLRLELYKRFEFGVNQLFVYKKRNG